MQSRISASKENFKSPAEGLYDISSNYIAVWGVAFGAAWIVDYTLKALTPLPYGWRMGLSGFALYLTVMGIFV